jgi:thymidylate synthase (FAD)
MELPIGNDWRWKTAMQEAEAQYIGMLQDGWTPQQARSVLPNSLKTEVVMTANLREWRHFFRFRCAETAHPQMREVAIPLHKELKLLVPVVFDDITYKE